MYIHAAQKTDEIQPGHTIDILEKQFLDFGVGFDQNKYIGLKMSCG